MKTQTAGTINVTTIDTDELDTPRHVELYSRAPVDETSDSNPPVAAVQDLTPREALQLAAQLLGRAWEAHGAPASPLGAELKRVHTAAVKALAHTEHTGTVSIVDGGVECSRCGGDVIRVNRAESWDRFEIRRDDQVGVSSTNEGDWKTVHVRCEVCGAVLELGDIVINPLPY